MTTKSPGQIAYETAVEGKPGLRRMPWANLGKRERDLWHRIEEAVRVEIMKPVPGWRDAGEPDPHGARYDCTQDQLSGGHFTDDQVAFALGMTGRKDCDFEGVLSMGKDRIRWLSRRLHGAHTSLAAAVAESNRLGGVLALRDSRITALERRQTNAGLGFLPPGAIEAYGYAYAQAFKPGGRHLPAHAAGICAVIRSVFAAPETAVATPQAPITVPTGQHGVAGGEAGLREALVYTPQMGAAAEVYIKSVAFKGEFNLPARFRFSDMWDAMLAAALASTPRQPSPGASGEREALAETSDEIFDRLRIENMVREWCESLSNGPPGTNFVDGLIEVLRLRFKRIDPGYRPTSKAARAALVAIADARGLIEDRHPIPIAGAALAVSPPPADTSETRRADYAETRRQHWQHEAERLAYLVRSLGGDPETTVSSPPAEMAGVEEFEIAFPWVDPLPESVKPPLDFLKARLLMMHNSASQSDNIWRRNTVALAIFAVEELAALRTRQDTRAGGAVETFETIQQWCEETFGPITPARMVERAGEEFEELRAEPDNVTEAADVVICLARYPGLWAEVERKMAVNRGRRWRLMGDGTDDGEGAK